MVIRTDEYAMKTVSLILLSATSTGGFRLSGPQFGAKPPLSDSCIGGDRRRDHDRPELGDLPPLTRYRDDRYRDVVGQCATEAPFRATSTGGCLKTSGSEPFS